MEFKKYISSNITIVGKPNVGKSSLLNAIFNKKIASVTHKPQTTRNKFNFDYIKDDQLINFVDTPGFHKIKNILDKNLNNQVKNSIQEVDLILFLTDISKSLNDEDIELLENINKTKKPVFLVITKTDLINNDINKINLRKEEISKYINFKQTVNVSSIKNDLSNLLELIFDFNKKNNNEIYKLEEEINNDNYLITEIIRETCLELLDEEIPYGVYVNLDSKEYLSDKNLFNITCSISVEKESHKKIVIGKNGDTIKEIGIESRKKLLSVFDTKIFLKLFVKVEKDWRNNLMKIKEFGYYNKH